MKRSNSSQDLLQKKRAKVAPLPEDVQSNHKLLGDQLSTSDSDKFPALDEVTRIFTDMVPYPADLMVKGDNFQICAHGLFLFVKSDSLKSIICQPGNSEKREWELDPAITENAVIEFLKNFYPNVEPDFANLSPKDYIQYYTLVDMHLDSKYLESFTLFFQKQCKEYSFERKGFLIDPSSEVKETLQALLILALLMGRRAPIKSQRKVLFCLYSQCMSANVHLAADKIQTYWNLVAQRMRKRVRFPALVILCYIALKNNLSFQNIGFPEDLDGSISLKALAKFYRQFILKNASIDRGRACEMFTNLIMWVTTYLSGQNWQERELV